MIPEFVDIGAPWKVLPAGIHDATLDEVESRFATTERRKKLFRGFLRACKSLKSVGCPTIYLDGSYITDISSPTDYDVCWNPTGVDDTKIDPIFIDPLNGSIRQKAKYGGEFYPSSARANKSALFIKFFQTDKETGLEKGIIRINL